MLGSEIGHALAAEQRHDTIDFLAIDRERTTRAGFAGSRSPVQWGTADHNGIGPQCERLDDVTSATETTIDDHGNALAHGRDDVGQHRMGGIDPSSTRPP